MPKCFEYTYVFVLGWAWVYLDFGGWGGEGREQISCESLQKFCIGHPPFTRQIYSHHREWKSLLVMQGATSVREDKMPGHSKPSKAQAHLKTSENRRAVQDTTMKKQKKSLGSMLFFTMLPEKCFNAG